MMGEYRVFQEDADSCVNIFNFEQLCAMLDYMFHCKLRESSLEA